TYCALLSLRKAGGLREVVTIFHRLRAIQSRKEILKKRVVNRATFRMILHRQGKRVIAQADLFYDVVVRAPSLNLASLRYLIDGLVMRAVNLFEAMPCAAIDPQWLNVMFLLLRKIVTLDVELQCAP